MWWWLGIGLILGSTLVMVFLLRAYYQARLMQMPAMYLWLRESPRFRRVKAPPQPTLRAVPRAVEWLFFDFTYENGAWTASSRDATYQGAAGPREEVPRVWMGTTGVEVTGPLKDSLDTACRQAIVDWLETPASPTAKESDDGA